MDNQPEGSNPSSPPEPANPNWILRGIQNVKRSFQDHRAKKKQENPADRAARRTAVATIWIAIFTAVTAVVAGTHFYAFHGQLEVMRETLAEMKTGAPQATKLVEANQKLAQATADMAATAKANLETTGALAGRQLRAKISIPSAEIENFDVGTFPNVFVQIENTGQGTANGKMRGIVKIVPVTDTNFSIDRKTLSATVTSHPNSKLSRTIQAGQRMTEAQMQAVATGKSAIIVFGDYRFTDESKTVTHCVYRLFYRSGAAASVPGIGGPWVPAPSAPSKPPILRPTAGYNHCDEDKPAPSKSPR